MTDLTFLLRRAHQGQEPALFLVGGVVWAGYVQSCEMGSIVAVVRPVGSASSYAEKRWRLDEIADMSLDPGDDEDATEDELFVNARRMIEQAREYGEMSLAERLLKDRETREEHHGRG